MILFYLYVVVFQSLNNSIRLFQYASSKSKITHFQLHSEFLEVPITVISQDYEKRSIISILRPLFKLTLDDIDAQNYQK